MNELVSQLQGWLARKQPGLPFLDPAKSIPKLEFGGFVTFDAAIPVHEAGNAKGQSLEQCWQAVQDYVRAALEIIEADDPLWLDREEVEMIQDALGPPPPQCYPLYMISTVDTAGKENCVYIGKTSSGKRRFSGGHAAFAKLLSPAYAGHQTFIYSGCITLLNEDNDYLPLEFVTPLTDAETLLRSIEAQLIYELQPALNTQHRKRYNAAKPLMLHIQNFSSDLMNDRFLYGPAGI